MATDELGGEAACALPVHGDVVEELTDHALADVLRRTSDAVVVADRAGDVLLWNDGATRLLGWTAEQMVGRPMSAIVPERLRARHDAGFHRTMETGETQYGDSMLQVPAQHRDGHTVSVAFTVTLLWHPGQKAPYAIAAIMRDDTERWELARAVRLSGGG
ncbi:PAS domain S-box protein [Actinomarinicola tropica]|uniref:PAS domain S-box protein n=1 Tax=Actinomarinicola tropica TaxID=2789776 RepID=A0A5Q2RI53_9ACTN|nr:PAS domain S-box protein [Actinomarinicola tropica]QGG93677.1 PAS domain S-box protein [Actinomarinicola tropica]